MLPTALAETTVEQPDLLKEFHRMAVENGVEDYEALYSDYQQFIIPNMKKEKRDKQMREDRAENGARISRGYCVTLDEDSVTKVAQKEWGFSGNMNITVKFDQFKELQVTRDSFVEIEISAKGKKGQIELVPGNIQRPFIDYIPVGYNKFQMSCKFKATLRTNQTVNFSYKTRLIQLNHSGCPTSRSDGK